MKFLILSSIFLLGSVASADTLTLADIAGKYTVTTEGLPVENTVEITADGKVKLNERSPYGELDCDGKVSISDERVVTSEMTCDNGQPYTQVVKLADVSNFDSFTAPVFASLHNREVEMNFKKVVEE